MPNYMFAYTGGGAPESEAEGKAVTQAWFKWMGDVGPALVDGGAPFGGSKAVDSDGKASESGATNLTGYSIVRADSFADAEKFAASCPQLTAGGAIDIYETQQIEM